MRKCPEMSAKHFSLNTSKQGLDGNMYKVVKRQDGNKTWRKMISKKGGNNNNNNNNNQIYNNNTFRDIAHTIDQTSNNQLIQFFFGLPTKITMFEYNLQFMPIDTPSFKNVKKIVKGRDNKTKFICLIYQNIQSTQKGEKYFDLNGNEIDSSFIFLDTIKMV